MKKINAVYVSLVALVLAVASLIMNIVCCASGKNSDVEAALMDKPQMIINAMQAYEEQQRAEAMKKVEENIKANADELYNRAGDGIIANPEGKIVLVEFFDYSCGFCGKLYPTLKEVIAKNPDVKVVAKPMAFLSPASKIAAEASLAAVEQGKFAEAYNAIFGIEGRLDEAKINAALEAAGIDMEKLKADMKSEKVQETMRSVSELAGKIQVTGVPTLVLNNKVLQTLDADVIQQAIDAAK
ncbi:MAG: DsbA family protein [Alphaproteobacteria bacterium]|nr:DsbA family protein [Alphaproteobacteria bacterium]